MKKLLYFAAAVLAIAACQKEVNAPLENTPVKTHTVTIKAGFSEDTKTAYDAQGKFSWVAGDQIGVVVSNEAGEEQVVTFITQESGPIATFAGEVPDGSSVSTFASYPYVNTSDYISNNFVYDPDKKGFRLWGSIKPSLDDPLSCVPLLGTRKDDGNYEFCTATGILKFTVENVPVETAFAYMEIPSSFDKQTYNLNGWYDVSENAMISMESAVEPWQNKYNWNAPTDYNQTIDYWFFIPEGVIPAGSLFELRDNKYATVKSFEIKQDITVKRNIVTKIAPLAIEEVNLFTLDDIIGEYEVLVTAHSYGSSSEPGDLVLEESDNSEKGNVMLTKFAGVSGKQYGTFDGKYITFPKNQIFGANPFSDSETKPFVAIDFFNGGVVDAQFEVLERGKICGINAEAFGLRTCTEEDWASYGGGWPWAVAYGSITATWKKDPDWNSLGTGKFIDNFVWPFAGLTDYAEVEFQQDVNHEGVFRIAKPYPGENSGEWFVINIANPKAVMSDPYFVDVEVTADGKATFKPWVRNGDYDYNYSDVLNWQQEGVLPANIEIGPCYRGDAFETEGYDYEIGKDHEEMVILIVFPGCEPFHYPELSGEISDVVGAYAVETVDYWNNKSTTTITIAASDNSEKGNIMITEFAGHTVGDATTCAYTYGNYADGTMTFASTKTVSPFYIDGNGAKHVLANYNGDDVKFTAVHPGQFILHSDMWIIGNRWETTESSGFDTFWTSYKAKRQ